MMLQEKRLEKGLSQSKLAKASGVNLRTIQTYEIKARNINKAELDKLVRLAIALDCHITDILDDKELIALCKKVKL